MHKLQFLDYPIARNKELLPKALDTEEMTSLLPKELLQMVCCAGPLKTCITTHLMTFAL
jgi:hypothetical protein